jgi:hypothetical protein
MGNGLRFTMFAATLAYIAFAPGGMLAGDKVTEKPGEFARNPLSDLGTWRYQIRYRSIVEALALTPDQLERLELLDAEMTAADDEEARRQESMSETERAASNAKLTAETRAFAVARGIRFDELSDAEKEFTVIEYLLCLDGRDFDRRSSTILRPEQRRRAAEIACRLAGPEIFHREYRSPFELSIEQKLKFDELLERHRAELEKVGNEMEDVAKIFNQDGVEAAIAAYCDVYRKLRIRQRVDLEKLVGMLNQRQKQTFDRLRGKEFDVARFDEEDARKQLSEE